MPEAKEDAIPKTYKISFGVQVGRGDIEKTMYIDGLQYLNLSYGELVIIEATGKQVLDEAFPKLREALLQLGFAAVESTGSEEDKVKLRSMVKTK